MTTHRSTRILACLLLGPLAACGREAEAPTAPPPVEDVGATPEETATGAPWSFASTEVGAVPAGLEVVEGRWAVADLPAGRGLLQSATNDNPVFNVVLFGEPKHADVDIAVDVHALEGSFDRGGGPVWRARDGRNYYVARWNPLEDNFRAYKVVDGVRTELASAETASGAMSRRVRVVAAGRRIRCWLDDALLIDFEDDTFTAPGRVGLWAKADARTLFTDLAVKQP